MSRGRKRFSKSSTDKEVEGSKGKSQSQLDESKANRATDSTINESSSKDNLKGIPSAANDPEWYSRDPQLLLDAGNIPFSKPFGSDIDLFEGDTAVWSHNLATSHNTNATPGICSLVLKPSGGSSLFQNSPLNVCANALYTHVRYVNSGRKNYDPADLMMYALAFGDIYSFLIWCIRCYNYAFMYSQRNWYIGRDLLYANNVDPDWLVANLANFRYWINSIINKISSYCVPGDIYYFKRRVFLFSNYYIENPYNNEKDQLYQFVPHGWYKFDFDSNGAGKLLYTPMDRSHLWNGTDFATYFTNMMSNITGDEDFGLMSGDILKAYGDNIIHLSQIGPEAMLLPVHDPYVLSQFKNAVCVGSNIVINDTVNVYHDMNNDPHIFGDIEQSTDGIILSQENVDWTASPSAAALVQMRKPISLETPVPGPGDVIEATRLIPSKHIWGSPTPWVGMLVGTEVAVSFIITYRPAKNSTTRYETVSGSTINMQNISGFGQALAAWGVQQKLAFKYAPIQFAFQYNSGTDTIEDMWIVSNMDNTTMLSYQNITQLHEVALLSLFYVPGVAKLI